METVIYYIADLLWDWPLIVTILTTGIYYTLTCKFFQFKYFKHICQSTFGSSENHYKISKNTMTGMEAFFTAIATTSGVGNITGVATAITIGGPGALFWLLLTGFIGMIIKMAEVTLAVYYRDEKPDGRFESGPMHYIEKGIGIEMNFGKMRGPILVFSIGIMSTLFITIQNTTASTAMSNALGVNGLFISLTYVFILYVAIFKGIHKTSKVFKILVPIVSCVYIGSGFLVLFRNLGLVLPAIKWILSDAFKLSALLGGVAGQGIGEVIRQGVSRAVYSNEAGWGTTPMIHGRASTDHPIKIGFWGAIEVFFDTIVICFTTGIVVVIAMVSGYIAEPFDLIIHAFSMGIGSLALVIIPLTIFLFGLSTSIGWYSYYDTILNFFSSRSKLNVQVLKIAMKYIYPLPGLVVMFFMTGVNKPSGLLWAVSDILAGLPTFVNVFAVLILSNKFFDLLKDYEMKFIEGKVPEETIPIFYSEESFEKEYL